MAQTFFGQEKKGFFAGLELNITSFLTLVLMFLIFFQVIGLVFNDPLGINIRLGPVIILIPVVLSSFMSIAIFKKIWTNQMITKQDMFAILFLSGIGLLTMFYLPEITPEIFRQSVFSLQSMAGFGG